MQKVLADAPPIPASASADDLSMGFDPRTSAPLREATTDPARRQMLERARIAGVRSNPIIEVEYLASALALVAEGIGDTIACRAAFAPWQAPSSAASWPR